ncbi:unnamed protein product [Amoebophrya sp. A25]|nr:unnamed protein product [Amoebophrya sp. A25]|eukprot:GSA25T00016164001.1
MIETSRFEHVIICFINIGHNHVNQSITCDENRQLNKVRIKTIETACSSYTIKNLGNNADVRST